MKRIIKWLLKVYIVENTTDNTNFSQKNCRTNLRPKIISAFATKQKKQWNIFCYNFKDTWLIAL